jgi:hypothetical protein
MPPPSVAETSSAKSFWFGSSKFSSAAALLDVVAAETQRKFGAVEAEVRKAGVQSC